jgi:hypothetical protein
MLAKHEVIIPLSNSDGSRNDDVVRAAALAMADAFRSPAMQHNEHGYSFSDANEISIGDVAIVTAYARTSRANRRLLKDIARMVLEGTDESAVLIADGRGAELVRRK